MNAYDDRPCELGEGPLWHPERRQFFWFDILNRRLLSREGARAREWRFDRMASAAGWVDRDRLLIATETGLALLDLQDGAFTEVADIEADIPSTRSNDGRADRQGGFWFSTMGKSAEAGRGSIYRYYRGQVRRIVEGLTISNGICFAPDGRTAYYSCTRAATVWRQPLDADGWPESPAQLFLDLSSEGANPDGAVVDAEGGFCCALWGRGAVRRYDPNGRQTHEIAVPGRNSSCPAFGGDDMRDMLVTTAQEGIERPDALQGLPYLVRAPFAGLPEPRVIL